jgi:hypothetical protein
MGTRAEKDTTSRTLGTRRLTCPVTIMTTTRQSSSHSRICCHPRNVVANGPTSAQMASCPATRSASWGSGPQPASASVSVWQVDVSSSSSFGDVVLMWGTRTLAEQMVSATQQEQCDTHLKAGEWEHHPPAIVWPTSLARLRLLRVVGVLDVVCVGLVGDERAH